MGKIAWYIFVLILVFLLVVYYKGVTSDVNAGGSVLETIILFLQGRNSQGQVANYPQG